MAKNPNTTDDEDQVLPTATDFDDFDFPTDFEIVGLEDILPQPTPSSRRRAHVPTKEKRGQVEVLSGVGVPLASIAIAVGCESIQVLRRHYSDQLAMGQAKAIAKVANNLFRMATGTGKEALTAAMFFLKCQAQWKTEVDPTVHTLVAPVTTISPELAEKIQALGNVREKLTAPMGFTENNQQMPTTQATQPAPDNDEQ